MSERRMLILPADLVAKIDANRGDMSQEEFINFLIDSQLNPAPKVDDYVTQDALRDFEHGIKDLLRSFLEFVVSYGLELGKLPGKDSMEELTEKLGGNQKPLGTSRKD